MANFEAFLEVFVDAFEEHDKIQWTIRKIHSLCQESCFTSIYALDFRQLACDIIWDEQAFINQIYWKLRNGVKDLLLSLFDLQTFNEDIN